MKTLTTVIVPADSEAYVAEIPNTLEDMQELVGGYIQTARLTSGIDIVCNEEVHIIGLPVNRNFPAIVGTFFLIRNDYMDGEMHGLNSRIANNWREAINNGVLI